MWRRLRRNDELADYRTEPGEHRIALNGVVEVSLPGLREPRALVVVGKIAPTSEKYPRRPGVPAKRPIDQWAL